MVKVIPWTTVCKHCDVKLEYYNEDIKFEYQKAYIICPNCGKKVILFND